MNSPNWLINLPIILEEGVWGEGFVVDIRDGRVITDKDLALSGEYHLIRHAASPDGKWLAISLWNRNTREQEGLYLTSTADLTAGRIVEGVSVAGWHTDAPAVIFRDDATGTLSVAQLPLVDATPGVALTGAPPPLVALPGRLFAVDAGSPARLLQFDLDGNLLDALDLSAHYDSIDFGAGAIDRLFLSVTQRQSDGACKYALVEWVVGLNRTNP